VADFTVTMTKDLTETAKMTQETNSDRGWCCFPLFGLHLAASLLSCHEAMVRCGNTATIPLWQYSHNPGPNCGFIATIQAGVVAM